MAGREIEEILSAILGSARKPLDNAALKAAEKAARAAAQPIRKAPKPGEKLTIPSINVNKGVLDPQGYSGVKLARPIEAYAPKVDLTGSVMRPKKTFEPSTLADQDAYFLPLLWDRTAGEGAITGVGDMATQRRYANEGGKDFMRGKASIYDNAIVASGGDVINRFAKEAAKAPEGAQVLPIMITMGMSSSDFATTPARLAVDMLQQSVTKKNASKFDERVREMVPSWPGLLSDTADEFLLKTGGENRKALLSLIGSEEGLSLGVPTDVAGAARYATTDTSLRTMPSNYAGSVVGRIDRDSPVIANPSYQHSAYPAQLRGEYLGELEQPMHVSNFFPEAYESYALRKDKSGNPLTEQHKIYALSRELPLQKATPELLENYYRKLERAKQLGFQPGLLGL